jgi:hypothetical protein
VGSFDSAAAFCLPGVVQGGQMRKSGFWPGSFDPVRAVMCPEEASESIFWNIWNIGSAAGRKFMQKKS